jgi:hypothetical protein
VGIERNYEGKQQKQRDISRKATTIKRYLKESNNNKEISQGKQQQ